MTLTPSSDSPYDNYGYAVLTANALRTPDRTALAYRGERYSFDALNRRVNKRANALAGCGIQPGQRVGSLLSDALPIAELYLAEAKLGAVIAAFNAFWDDEMVVQMALRSGLHAMVFDAAHAAQVARVKDRLPAIGLWLSVGGPAEGATDLDALVAKASDAEPALGAFAGDPMAFFYTSGTSGTSKAVMHTHSSCKAMSELLLDMPHGEDDVWGTGPIIWGIGFPCTLGAALYVGMTVALEDDFGPANFLKTVQRERVSHCTLIPSQIADLLANHPHQDYDLSSLKIILSGGEPMGPTLLAKIKARFPEMQLWGFYGQTELPYACAGRLEDPTAGVGRPRTRCAVRILTPEGKHVVGEAGELVITGPQRLTAYYGQPEKTAETLRDGWFYTGDIARVDEAGRMHVLGRKEDAISKGGRYVRPADIEDLVQAIPGVGEAGVVGSPAAGTEQKIILAVSPARGASLTEHDVRAGLLGKLPPEAQPDLIVVADELPHTQDGSGGRGKLLRRDIRTRYEPLLAGK